MCRIKLLLLLALAVAYPLAQAQDLIRIPAGPFRMGSNNGREDERPEHTVTLATFEIDRLQVTNADFAMFLERHVATDSYGRRYPWGDALPTASLARFASGWNDTVAVNTHAAQPSPYGVIGMAGNAWHWVSSAYRPYPYRDDDGREDIAPGPLRARGD